MSSITRALLILTGVYVSAMLIVLTAWCVGARNLKRRYRDIRKDINGDVFGTFDIPDWTPKTIPTEKDLEE